MTKNEYFNAVEKIAKEMELPCNKHNPHFWISNHPHKRYVTFYHKILFLVFKPNGKYRIEASMDMDYEIFNTLFKEMKKFIRKVKEDISK